MLQPLAQRKQRVLFIAEAVTLAHVARPLALARSLDPALYEVSLACDPRFNTLFSEHSFAVRPIRSIPRGQFLHALATGSPAYDAGTLRAYVADDLKVIQDFRPDLVVGDFRLSLAVSARVANTPYLAITDACWSPYARQVFSLAEHRMMKIVGERAAQSLFRVVRPVALAHHAQPLNTVRQEYGLPSLGLDLRRVYTDADHTLYADIPEMTPAYGLPANHHYLGPVLWSPAVARPGWWGDLPAGRPVIYVNLGSSGKGELLPAILAALADLPVSVVAATAGRIDPGPPPSNAFVTDFLRGEEAAARARVVICNGGSPATHQALSAGVPVLGIAGNMNQHLNMQPIRHAGAGELLRARTATVPLIRAAVMKMLDWPSYAESAAALARALSSHHAPTRFRDLVAKVSAQSCAAA